MSQPNMNQSNNPISNLTLDEQQNILGQLNPGLMMKMMQDMMPFLISNNPKVIQITLMNKQLMSKVQVLQNQLNEANLKCQQVMVQNNQFQRMAQNTDGSQKAQVQQLEMSLNHHKEENSRLRTEINDLNSELSNSRTANMSENQTIDHLQKQLESKREDIQSLQKRIDDLNNENLKNTGEISTLKIEIDKIQYKQKFSEDKKEELEKQLQRKSNQLEMIEKGEIRLKEELQKLRSEFDNIKAQNITIQGDLTNKSDKLIQQERENERLLNKMNNFEKICIQLEEKDRDLELLGKNFDGVQGSYQKLQGEFDLNNQELQLAKDKIHEFKMENNRLIDQIETTKRSVDDQIFQFKREKRNLEGQVRRLEDEVEVLSKNKRIGGGGNMNNVPSSPATFDQQDGGNSQMNVNGSSRNNYLASSPQNLRNSGSNLATTPYKSRNIGNNDQQMEVSNVTPSRTRNFNPLNNNQTQDHFNHNHPSNTQLPIQNQRQREPHVEPSYEDHFNTIHPSNGQLSPQKMSRHTTHVEPSHVDHFSSSHPSNPHFENKKNKSYISAPYFTHNKQDHFKNQADVDTNTHNHEKYPPGHNPITRNYPPQIQPPNEQKAKLRGALRNRRTPNNRGSRRWDSQVGQNKGNGGLDRSMNSMANTSQIADNTDGQNLAQQYRAALGGKEKQRVEIESQLLHLQMQKDNVRIFIFRWTSDF